jgi:hypothetical protein
MAGVRLGKCPMPGRKTAVEELLWQLEQTPASSGFGNGIGPDPQCRLPPPWQDWQSTVAVLCADPFHSATRPLPVTGSGDVAWQLLVQLALSIREAAAIGWSAPSFLLDPQPPRSVTNNSDNRARQLKNMFLRILFPPLKGIYRAID